MLGKFIVIEGLKTLVDAVGGITVESEKAFRTSEGGFYINRGTNQLNGTVASSLIVSVMCCKPM